MNAFCDVCSKSEQLDFVDEVSDLRDLDDQEGLSALYDRLCMVWDETGEDPDGVIKRYKLFVDKEKE